VVPSRFVPVVKALEVVVPSLFVPVVKALEVVSLHVSFQW
jgi:hypothetical protein